MKRFFVPWQLLILGLSCAACEPGIAFEGQPFGTYPPRRHLNLKQLLGDEVTLVSATDTLRLRVRFEPATRLNLVTHASSGDTLLHAWLMRHRCIYYLAELQPDSSYWVHSVRINGNQVRGLLNGWKQMNDLAQVIEEGRFAEVIRARTPDGKASRLHFDAEVLRAFYAAELDSCPVYHIQPRQPAQLAGAPVPIEDLIRGVYPNPAQDQTTVELAGSTPHTLELFDSQGRRQLLQTSSAATSILNLRMMPAGTYILRVQVRVNGRQLTASRRLMVRPSL